MTTPTPINVMPTPAPVAVAPAPAPAPAPAAPVVAPEPSAQHHFNLALLLQIIAALTPAIIAPFASAGKIGSGAASIIAAEAGVVGQIAPSLGSLFNQ